MFIAVVRCDPFTRYGCYLTVVVWVLWEDWGYERRGTPRG